MEPKFKYLTLGIAGITAIIFAVLFWPEDSTDSNVKFEAEKLEAEFLTIDPAWAEGILETMTLQEKVYTIIVHKVDEFKSENDTLLPFGGWLLTVPDYQLLARIDTSVKDSLRPIIGLSYSSFLNDLPEHTTQNILASQTQSQINSFTNHVIKAIKHFGVNFIELGHRQIDTNSTSISSLEKLYSRFDKPLIDSLLKDSLLCSYNVPVKVDSSLRDEMMAFYKMLKISGLTALNYTNKNTDLHKEIEFKGLVSTHLDSSCTQINFQGSDLFITNQPKKLASQIESAIKLGQFRSNDLDKKVKRVLMARKWSKASSAEWHNSSSARFFERMAVKWHRSLQRTGILVVKNEDNILPFKEVPKKIKLIRIGEKTTGLYKGLSHYSSITSSGIDTAIDVKKINWKNPKKIPVVICLNNVAINQERDSVLWAEMQALDQTCNVTIINVGHYHNLTLMEGFETIIQLHSGTQHELESCGQMLFGGYASKGFFPFTVKAMDLKEPKQIQKTRLAFALPIDAGLDKDTLGAISWFANQGIFNRAFPGCQVTAVKDGMVIWNKPYGYATYARREKITNKHLYDLASVTKVAATTMAAMKLYDEQKFKLNDSIETYLPDTLKKHLYNGKSTLRHITWRQMLIHKSGLPAGIPYIKYVDYITDSVKRFDRFYCDWSDDSLFYTPIADGFYMDKSYQDSIWVTLNQMWLREDRDYVYSDANFVILYKLLRHILDLNHSLVQRPRQLKDNMYNAFETYLQEQVYRPLQMNETVYLPRRYFDKKWIAPTEQDKYWRKQLVHGYVHDPTAALMGGISGNAGLFSTGNDMAVLFQMLLNKGTYGGKRYISEETVQMFTRKQADSHRGLGFNKPVGGGMYGIPEEVSNTTFGHTGFTGNSIWTDPENKIVYIFLSNRSHPDAHNPKIIHLGTRKHIHKAIYRSIIRAEDYLTVPESIIVSDSLSL